MVIRFWVLVSGVCTLGWSALFSNIFGTDELMMRWVVLIKIVTLLCCLLPIKALLPDDRLRVVWEYFSISLGAYILRDSVLVLGVENYGLQVGFLVVGNTCNILALWRFAALFRQSGLSYSLSKYLRAIVWSVTSLLVVGLVFPGVISSFYHGLLNQTYIVQQGLIIVSGLGDAIASLLMAPIFMAVLTMRGGLVRPIWLCIMISLGFWLLFDAFLYWYTPAADYFRVCALVSMGLAGLYQWRNVKCLPSTKEVS